MARKKKVYINRRRRKPSAVVPALVIVVISAVAAFTGAYAWQSISGDDAKLEAKMSMSEALEASFGSSSGESSPSSKPDASSAAASQSGDPAATSSGEDVPEEQSSAPELPASGEVPEGKRVKSDYFDDAMFVGDSITNGILSYQLMENATVISYTGINPDTIRTKEVYRNADGNLITILDAMKENAGKAAKIYILLGSNGIAWLDQAHFIQSYEEFLDDVKAQHPGAIIYVQSIPPINEEIFPDHYTGDVTNEKIDSYNADIAAMAQRAGVYYLDIAQAFKDSAGGLPKEATTDGMHFTTQYYQKWFDYLKTHAIQP